MPEKEYIEREALLENLHKFAPEHNTPLIQLLVTRQPTADVVEVRHGEWIESVVIETDISKLIHWSCSYCGIVVDRNTDNFCPHCGAKMDGKEKR